MDGTEGNSDQKSLMLGHFSLSLSLCRRATQLRRRLTNGSPGFEPPRCTFGIRSSNRSSEEAQQGREKPEKKK